MKTSPILFTALAVSLAFHLSARSAGVAANLEVYCPLDEALTATGATAVAPSAIGVNQPLYAPGLLGQAAVFANNNAGATPSDWAINLGNLDTLYAGDFSMSMWIQTTNAGGGALTGNSNWASGNNTGWLVSTFNANREGKVKTSTGTRQNQGLAITDGNWHFVTLVVDNTNDRAFWYLDGVLINGAGAAMGSGTLAAGLDTLIGGSGNGVEAGAATVDDYALFSGMLTANQIAYLYNGGTGRTADQYNVTPPPKDLIWKGAAAGSQWSTSVIAAPKNWVLSSNGTTAADFAALDTVRFNDTATGTTVNINEGNVSPATVTFDHSAKSYTLAGINGITGGVELIKTGTSSLTLSNPNLHLGRTSVSDGRLVIDHATALQNSTLEAVATTGGSHTFGSITEATLGGLGGDGALALQNAANQPLALTVGGNNTNTIYAGAISGAGSLTKTGSGRLSLTGVNSWTGGVNVAAGSLQGQGSSAFPPGMLASTGGTIEFAVPAASETVVTNTFLLPDTGSAALRMFAVFGEGGVAPTPGTTVRLTGKISGGSFGRFFRFSDTGISAEHDNVLILDNSTNDFLGTVELYRATLAITSDAALGDPDNDLSHFSENLLGKIRFDADNIELNPQRTISLPGAANNRPFDTQGFTATLAGPLTGTGTLVKQGPGRLILTSLDSSFTGIVNVAEGVLQIDGFLPPGVLSVGLAGTLAGNGNVARDATVNGGVISPGAGASLGTLSGFTSLTFVDSTRYDFGISDWTGAAGIGYDTILSDVLNLTATDFAPITIKINPLALSNFTTEARKFKLVSTSSGVFGFDPAAFVVDASALVQSNSSQWTVVVEGNDLMLAYAGAASGSYGGWIAGKGLSGADASFTSDPDKDGISNGIEFVIGGEPNPANPNPNSTALLPVASADSTSLRFTFRRSTQSASLNPTVQYDADLQGSWTTAINGTNGVVIEPATVIEPGIEQVIVVIPRSLGAGGKLFARLAVGQ